MTKPKSFPLVRHHADFGHQVAGMEQQTCVEVDVNCTGEVRVWRMFEKEKKSVTTLNNKDMCQLDLKVC